MHYMDSGQAPEERLKTFFRPRLTPLGQVYLRSSPSSEKAFTFKLYGVPYCLDAHFFVLIVNSNAGRLIRRARPRCLVYEPGVVELIGRPAFPVFRCSIYLDKGRLSVWPGHGPYRARQDFTSPVQRDPCTHKGRPFEGAREVTR